MQIRQHAEREIIDASSFLTASPFDSQSLGQTSPVLVQKYLAVIDLTAGEAPDSSDQSAMLMALVDRFKGVAQALSSLSGMAKPPSHTDNLTVSDLYTWYVCCLPGSSFANRQQDECFAPRAALAQHFASKKCNASASDRSDDCFEVSDRPSGTRDLSAHRRTHLRCRCRSV